MDWEKIKQDYLTGKYTMNELAEKYKLSAPTIRRHSAAEDWKGQKKAYTSGLYAKAKERFESKEVERLADELSRESRIVNRISALLEKAAREQLEIQTVDADGNIISKVDLNALSVAAKTLKQIEEIKRSISGLTTVQEDRIYALNKERIEIERKRVERDTGGEDEGCGVLILPDVDSYEGGENEQ